MPEEVEITLEETVELVPVPKPWYRSKTLWFNIVAGSLAVLAFVAGDEFPVELPVNVEYWLSFALAIGNVILRFVTNEPIR